MLHCNKAMNIDMKHSYKVSEKEYVADGTWTRALLISGQVLS